VLGKASPNWLARALKPRDQAAGRCVNELDFDQTRRFAFQLPAAVFAEPGPLVSAR
jgi:hypothetical protein